MNQPSGGKNAELKRFTFKLFIRNISQQRLVVATRSPEWNDIVDGTHIAMLTLDQHFSPTDEIITESKDLYGLVVLEPGSLTQLPNLSYTTDDLSERAEDFKFFYIVRKPFADMLGIWSGEIHSAQVTEAKKAAKK